MDVESLVYVYHITKIYLVYKGDGHIDAETISESTPLQFHEYNGHIETTKQVQWLFMYFTLFYVNPFQNLFLQMDPWRNYF
jgi:hypothetical protein